MKDLDMLSVSGSAVLRSDLSQIDLEMKSDLKEGQIAENYVSELLTKVWGQQTWQIATDQELATPSFLHLAGGSLDIGLKARSKSHFQQHQKDKLEGSSDSEYLEDRCTLRKLLVDDEIDEAVFFFTSHGLFGPLYTHDASVRVAFDCLRFLKALRTGKLAEAIELAQNQLSDCIGVKVAVCYQGKIKQMKVEEVVGLLSYGD